MIPQSCDTMVALKSATTNGQTIFAKNSDRPADECQPLELHPRKTHPTNAQTQCQFITLPEASIPLVRNCWRELQTHLFKTAYPLAEEAHHLINTGSKAKATQLLTDYMTQNTQHMLDIVRTLIKTCKHEAA